MDILFPWRKQPYPDDGPGGPSSHASSGGDGIGYGSLPHPAEHAHHYSGGGVGGVGTGGGGGGNGHSGNPQQLRRSVMQSFVSSSSGGDATHAHPANASHGGQRSNYTSFTAGGAAGADGHRYDAQTGPNDAASNYNSHYDGGDAQSQSQYGTQGHYDEGTESQGQHDDEPMRYSEVRHMVQSQRSIGSATRQFLGSSFSTNATSDPPSAPPQAQVPPSGVGRPQLRDSYAMHTLGASDRSGFSRDTRQSLGTGVWGSSFVSSGRGTDPNLDTSGSTRDTRGNSTIATREDGSSGAAAFRGSSEGSRSNTLSTEHPSGRGDGGRGRMGPLDETEEYDDEEDGTGERPKFRSPLPLDQSARSNASDLSDRTGRLPQDTLGRDAAARDAAYFRGGAPDLVPVEEDGGYYDAGANGGGKPDRRALLAATAGGYQTESSRIFASSANLHQSSRTFANKSSYHLNQSSRTFATKSYSQINHSSRTFATAASSGMYEEEEEEDLPVSPLRQLLDAINMSILPPSLRLSSLAQAVEFFDHRDRAMHDAELREGGAFVLYHKLGLALRLSRCGESAVEEGSSATKAGPGGPTNHLLSYQRSLANSLAVQQQTEFDKEIAMICACLEMVHRANPDAIAQTWDECGTEILPLLVRVLERPFQKIERAVWTALQEKAHVPGSLERAVATAVTRDQKLAVQKVTKVLAMYSLVPEAKRPICDCGGMLRWLTRIIDTHNYNRVKPGTPAFGGAAAAGLRDSAGGGSGVTPFSGEGEASDDAKAKKRLELATRATSGSGLYMTEAARFNTIATLTNLAALEDNRMQMLREPGLLDNICRAVHNERSDVPKQCSALAIMNLSNGDMDHVPEMARNDLVLETLLKLMKEDNPETRRNAVVTIFNVACSDQNTVRLARYRDGVVLEALVELVGSDDPVLRTHDEARANAAETLFNMSCSEISETTDRMANHAGLLECLAVTLRGEHTGLEVKMYCSATLRRMAELIRHPMIAQGALLSALVKAATWTNTDCIAEAFRAQASVPENCVIMAHHHGLLNALSRLALTRGEGSDVEKVRMASCLAIEMMSRQDEARALLSQNEGIVMALTKASYGDDPHEAKLRMSNMSELGGSVTGGGFLDSSERTPGRNSANQQDDGEDRDSDDDMSLQSRRIQVALKNLVAAM